MIDNEFTIIIDTREQKPWEFSNHAIANHKLDTGDYSIQGLESILAIERKRNISEFANNITESRFVDVIERLSQFKYAFILFEFDMKDVINYPIGSNIPKKLWNRIRISPAFIIKHIVDLQVEHNIKIIFCGNSANAEKIALSLMRKIYKKEQTKDV